MAGQGLRFLDSCTSFIDQSDVARSECMERKFPFWRRLGNARAFKVLIECACRVAGDVEQGVGRARELPEILLVQSGNHSTGREGVEPLNEPRR